MMTNLKRILTFLLPAVFILSAAACADISDSDRKMVKEVAARIFASVESVPDRYSWPPVLEIDPSDDVNAYATLGPHSASDEEFTPQVVILNGLLTELVKGNEDYLAYIIGHETAHLIHGDCKYNPATDKTGFLRTTFTREQEIAADITGMELAIKAGYSYKDAMKGIHKMASAGLQYASFEGLGVDHPSWKDRISFIDKEQASLWRAMSAFDNGNVFLMVEQYVAAERCFRQVTKEFPACHEAWANMGYSQLMRYCDGLETKDLRRFAIGQIVTGGFYRRPRSLELLVRGIDEQLWWDAVGALRESLRLNQNQPLVKANLGIAYLVHPGGTDIGEASQFLQSAAKDIRNDPTVGPLERAAVLLNAGVVDLAHGDLRTCSTQLDSAAEVSGQKFDSRGQLVLLAGEVKRLQPTDAITAALLYNRAQVLARSSGASERKQAQQMLEDYLSTASPASSWWPIAYDQYESLCKELKVEPKAREKCRTSASGFRPLTSVALSTGQVIVLSSSTSDLQGELGQAQEIPVVVNTSLKRLVYDKLGVEILATQEVIAIMLKGPNAPDLQLRMSGLGAETWTLRLGMSRDELEGILADEVYDFRTMTDPDVNYRFYRNLGLAVRVKQDKVIELLVVQIPEEMIA